MKKYLFLLFSFIYTHFLFAQAPNIVWDKTFGGSDFDLNPKVIPVSGGYLIAGQSDSGISGNKTTSNRGRNDYWLIKIDIEGNKLWDKNFGGASFDYLTDIIQSSDGGIVLAGQSSSNAYGEKSQNTRGSTDYWIVKVDINGNKLWDKTFGGERSDSDPKIIETNDGGYLIAGISESQNGFDKSEASRGLSDYWIIKVDALGNKLWDKTIGGNENDFLSDIIKLNDGSFIISGHSISGSSSEKTENSKGDFDFWIVKISSSGQKIWDKTFGGQFNDQNPKLLLLNDSNLIITGYSQSSSSGDKTDTNKGVGDFWVIKINSSGNILWNKTVGGANWDYPQAITSTVEGGFMISGHSNSGQSGDKSEVSRGDTDFWIVKFDNNGNITWNKTIGGDLTEELTDITLSTDGGFVGVGHSNSGLSGEKAENSKGGYDYWIVKLGGSINPSITVLPITNTVPSTAFSQNLTLQANANWSAHSNAAWLTVSPTSGVAGTFNTITYSGTANTSTSQRVGTITFTSGTATATLTVTQAGVPKPIKIENLPEVINKTTYTVPREATVHHYFLAKNSNTNLPVQNIIVNYKIGTQTTIRNSLPSDADGLIDLNVKVGGTDSTSSEDDWLGVGSGSIQYVGLTNATLSGQNDFSTNPFTINVIDKASPLDKEMGIGVGFRIGAPLFELPYGYKKKVGAYTLSLGSSMSGKLGMSAGRQIRIKPVSSSIWDIYFSGNLGLGLDLAGEAGFTFGNKNIKAGANTSLDTDLEGGMRFEKGYRIDLNNRTDVLKLGYLLYSLNTTSTVSKAVSLIFENLYNKYSTTPLTNNSLTTRREFSYGANYNFDLDTEVMLKIRAKGFNLPGYGNIPEIEPQYKVQSKGGFLDSYIFEAEKGVGWHTINSLDVDYSAMTSIQSMVNLTKGNRKNNPSAKSQPFEIFSTSIDNNVTVGRTTSWNDKPQSSFFSLGTKSNELSLDAANPSNRYNVIISNIYKYGQQTTASIISNYSTLQNNSLASFISMNSGSLVGSRFTFNIWNPFAPVDNTPSFYRQALNLHEWVCNNTTFTTPLNEIDLTSTRDISLIEKQEVSTDLSKYKIKIFKIKLDLAAVNLSSWSTYKHNLSKAVYVKSLNRALLTLDYPNITNNLEIPTTHPLLMIENAINSVLGGIDDTAIAESDDFMERTSAFVDELVDILWTNLWKPRKNSAGVTIYDPKQSLSTQSARIAANTPSVFTFTIPKTAFYANTKLDFDYYYPANEIEAITTTDTLRVISDVFTISATLNNTKLLNAPRANFNIQTVFSQTDLELASLPNNLVPVVVFLPHGSTVWEKIGALNTTFSFNRLGTYALAVKITNDDTPPTINVAFPSTFTAPNYIDVTLNDTQSGIDWAKVTFAANDLPIPYTRQGLTNTFRVNVSDLPTNANGIFNFYMNWLIKLYPLHI